MLLNIYTTREEVSDSEESRSESEDEAQDTEEVLLEKWKSHVMKANLSNLQGKSSEAQRRLFLIPTGVPGVNDHTLYEKVKQVDSYLWGFCQGLYTRIFLHVRPGDIFLFVSSGTGEFNRIARVNDIKVVPKSLADKFWSRMSYCMGGSAKSNVGFPLLTPIDKVSFIQKRSEKFVLSQSNLTSFFSRMIFNGINGRC